MNEKITKTNIDALKQDDKNFNKGTKRGAIMMKHSIETLGLGRSILLDKDNNIIAGNKTQETAKELGINDVVIVETDGTKVIAVKRTDLSLNSEKGREMALADNATGAANLDWDDEALARAQEEIGLSVEDWVDGFSFSEVKDDTDVIANDDYDIDSRFPKKAKTKFGDVYQLGKHRVICGDSTKYETLHSLMAGEKADLLITDPPYNVNYQAKGKERIANDCMNEDAFLQFLRDAFIVADDYLKQGGSYYIWHSDSHGGTFRNALESIGWKLRQCLIWNKNALVLGRQDYQWKHEPCLYGWKDGAEHYFTKKRNLTTMIEDRDFDINLLTEEEMRSLLNEIFLSPSTIIKCKKNAKNPIHPTMKPIPLIAELIKNSSKRGSVVLDIFGGSGTTLMAAEELDRVCYMVEFDPCYVDCIIDRWQMFTGGIAKKINGNE
ncbi:MAG: DNA modification methylase [Prevotella bivia]|nr:DNA modification methylase [Prevotella bivia]